MMLALIRKLFWVSRPISWPNTAYPFAAGFLLSGGIFGPVFVVGTLYFLISYNLMMYGINDVFDYESDILNPRKGGIEGMREERMIHPAIIKAVAITNIPVLLYLLYVSNLFSRVILILVVFMVIAYSIKGLRFKERPVLDSFTSSCHFVGPLLYGISLVGGAEALGRGWPYILAFFLWGMASHAFGAVQDIIPDRAGKLASIATVLGAKTTVRLTIVAYVAASILLIAQGGIIVLIGVTGLLYVMNVADYWSVSDRDSAQTNKAWKRFIRLNYFTGFVVTIVILATQLTHN